MKGLTSALWKATLKGEYDRANQLICSGANLNEPRNTYIAHGMTLLHYAVKMKDVQRMRLLINHGANCNACDSLKRTPLHWAILNYPNGDRPDIVELLINGGAIVDVRDIDQSTPLFMAIYNVYYQSAEKLIARGASVDAVSASGWPVLHMATVCNFGHDSRMLKMLIRLKINIEAENGSGYTALHAAVMNDITDSARLLLDNGADLNKKDKRGNSPLCIAVRRNFRDSVQLLLKRGARMNEVNDAGNTALHMACMSGFENVATLLVKFGANMNAPNRDGKTALQLWPPNELFSEANAKIIIREAVKREALGQPICEGYIQIAQSCAKYSEFDQNCRQEMKRLQSGRIDLEDSAMSFFDIFTKNEEKLAALARNKNIVMAFGTSPFLAFFRIYAIDFTTKFEKAKRRAHFLISIEDCLVDVIGDILPAPILQMIAAYVEEDDVIEY